MKVYFIDDNNNKRLVSENNTIHGIIEAVIEDRKKRFIYSPNLDIQLESNKYNFVDRETRESTGYFVEVE